MDLLKGNVRQIYFRYLGAAFGSALISSIYGLVDSAMVGQYQGPEGTAALAIVAPVWNIIYSLGLLTGIGGSVLLSAARGAGRQKEGDEYFTAALAGTVFFAAVSWLTIAFFDAPLLRLFGARDALLPLAQQYLLPVKFVVPLFLFNQMLAAFLRNHRGPGARRGLPRRRCWRAASSMCSAITFLCSPVTWAYSARGWQQPSARASPSR